MISHEIINGLYDERFSLGLGTSYHMQQSTLIVFCRLYDRSLLLKVYNVGFYKSAQDTLGNIKRASQEHQVALSTSRKRASQEQQSTLSTSRKRTSQEHQSTLSASRKRASQMRRRGKPLTQNSSAPSFTSNTT